MSKLKIIKKLCLGMDILSSADCFSIKSINDGDKGTMLKQRKSSLLMRPSYQS